MKISIIAAIGKNRELGKNGKIPWHIPEDFKRFKALTSGHPVIMGRKTWESLPIKPLPGRYNIVITRDVGFKINDLRKGKDFTVANSLEEALRLTKSAQGDNEVFVIGGGQIYQQAIGIADKLYLTIVEGTFDADTFFPDYSDFKKKVFEQAGESEGYKYKFLELEK
ncbi:MAG: dihydrofolate reductase [Candidatus Levybacteria bacterium]|nr:dihydrofolate reductase [Candidatus Levybacteria bacterium]